MVLDEGNTQIDIGNMTIDLLHAIGTLERGGAEKQLILLAQELQKRGWSQAGVTFEPGQTWDHRVRDLDIPLYGLQRGLSLPHRLWRFSQLASRLRPRIIHSWSLFTNAYTRWVPMFRPVQRVGSFRQDPSVHPKSGKKRNSISRAGIYRSLDCTIANTSMAFERMAAQNIRVRRAEVVCNIIHLGPKPNYHSMRNGALSGNGWHIVAVGRLIPLKAYDVLLQALSLLDKQGKMFTLSLAGSGPERESLESLASELGIAGKVRFLGEVDHVPELLSEAQMMVHPSRSEGLSNTILEGMAAGLPVVATATGGTPEIITDGMTGLLIPPDDPIALSTALTRLFSEPGLQERLGRAAYHWVAEHCVPEVITDRYEAIYKSLLSG